MNVVGVGNPFESGIARGAQNAFLLPLADGVAQRLAAKKVAEINVGDVAKALSARAKANQHIARLFVVHGLKPKVSAQDLLSLPGAGDVFTKSGGLQPKYAITFADNKDESALSYLEHPQMHGLGLIWDIFVGLTTKKLN